MRKLSFLTFFFFYAAIVSFGQEENISWRESYFNGEPMHIGNRVQFLFDDYLVEDKYGLERVVGPVEKYPGNPLDFGDFHPWELYPDLDGSNPRYLGIMVSNVIYDPQEKMYKGWYVIRRTDGFSAARNHSTLYVESRDGINWTKPELDLFPIDGQKTNIVLYEKKGTPLTTAHLHDVILDTMAQDPGKRYVALVSKVMPGENERCIVLMYSPDGKEWEMAEDPILFHGVSDGSYSLVRDNKRQQWLLYRRPPTQALVREESFYAGRNTKRRVSVAVSKDMRNWTYPRNIVVMDELDDSKLTQIGNKMDIDWAKVILYEGVYFGFLDIMDNQTITVPRQSQLMWSRDGFDWERLPDRQPFIENGKPGEWDAGSIGRHSMIPEGDSIRIYYGLGGNTPQGYYGQKGDENITRFRGTGLAFIGRDRFIGLQAGPEGGYLLTRQFVLEGDRIEINFRSQVQNPTPGLGSMIKAELLQPPVEHLPAQPYPGYTMKDCDPVLVKDELHQTISWNGKQDISELKGKTVYIRFYIRNTTLYTFRILDDN